MKKLTAAEVIPKKSTEKKTVFDQDAYESGIKGMIGLDKFESDPRFNFAKGQGETIVILDTGINKNHELFKNNKLVYEYDFANNDTDATDRYGHGTHVTGIAASSMAYSPAKNANIISLKVFTDSGIGSFRYIERALQWVNANVEKYNISSINMSLSDGNNFNTKAPRYGIGDELKAIADKGVITVSAAGNSFGTRKVEGAGYPGSDPNSIAVGATMATNGATFNYGSGATIRNSIAGQIAPFSQRSFEVANIFAPGAPILSASNTNNTAKTIKHGTSMAAPFVTGAVPILQQVAKKYLGRELKLPEFQTLMKETGVPLLDKNYGNTNVPATGKTFSAMNIYNMAEKIYQMSGAAIQPPVASFTELKSETVEGNYGEVDEQATLTYLVKLDKAATKDISLGVRMGFITTNWSDIGSRPSEVIFKAGETQKEIKFNPRVDNTFEKDEELTFTLFSRNNNNVKVDPTNATVTTKILNDDFIPRADILSRSIAEPAFTIGSTPSSRVLNYQVRLSNPSQEKTEIDLLIGGGTSTATKGVDYTVGSDTTSLVFNPGETVKIVPVTIFGDSAKEGLEFIETKLLNPKGGIIGRAQSQIWIRDTAALPQSQVLLPYEPVMGMGDVQVSLF